MGHEPAASASPGSSLEMQNVWAFPQVNWIRTYLLTFPGDSCVHLGLRSAGLWFTCLKLCERVDAFCRFSVQLVPYVEHLPCSMHYARERGDKDKQKVIYPLCAWPSWEDWLRKRSLHLTVAVLRGRYAESTVGTWNNSSPRRGTQRRFLQEEVLWSEGRWLAPTWPGKHWVSNPAKSNCLSWFFVLKLGFCLNHKPRCVHREGGSRYGSVLLSWV